MGRTARRPIPSNRINPTHALVFGVVLGALAFALFALYVNLLSAALALFALLFYVIVYTGWLKRRSTQNIVIGGAAGCFPPMIGWAAVTNQISLMPLLLFLIIFYWTPPHFWALALIRRDDYARAGIPMLPVVQGERDTKHQILLYSVIMVVITLLPFLFRFLGPIYLAGALVLGAIFMRDALRLWRESGTGSAWKLYKYSLLYLALLFAAMVLDAAVMRAIA
jgi:heme o synthase